MKKIKIAVFMGVIAGIIDVLPMIMMKLTWDANLSAFTMWIVIGFLLAITNLEINNALKGALLSFLVLAPTAILIGWHNPADLIPIFIITFILGSSLGHFVGKI